MITYWVSDLHLGHPRVAEIRGFDSISDHDDWIYSLFDDVTVYDRVFVLGDVIGRDRDWDAAEALLRSLSTHVMSMHLVAGNHDPCHPSRSNSIAWDRKYRAVFNSVAPYRVIRLEGKRVHMSHFPYITGDGHDDRNPEDVRWPEWRLQDMGHPLLHGHLHTPVREHGNQLHVGIDSWGRLVSETEVSAWLRRMAIERSPIAA